MNKMFEVKVGSHKLVVTNFLVVETYDGAPLIKMDADIINKEAFSRLAKILKHFKNFQLDDTELLDSVFIYNFVHDNKFNEREFLPKYTYVFTVREIGTDKYMSMIYFSDEVKYKTPMIDVFRNLIDEKTWIEYSDNCGNFYHG